MGNTIDLEELYGALRAIVINALVNNYAVERVAFGFEKPGDRAPINLYLKHLHLDGYDGLVSQSGGFGVFIDEHGHINAEQDCAEFVRDLFVLQMERIFGNAPKDVSLERGGEDIPLQPRFREYIFGLLPLFTEILNVEVEYNAFDIIPSDREARANEYRKWVKFVTAVLLKPLRAGRQINRYVKDFTNAPHYICRLIEKKGNNYYLGSANIDSYEYIFALFSLMRFLNDENGKILELKMFEWERRHKPE